MADEVVVTLSHGRDAVERIVPAWAALANANPMTTPLTGPDYVLAMRAAFSPAITPVCLVACARGEIVGVLPLGIEPVRRGLVQLRRLAPIAGRHTYFTDAVLHPTAGATVVAALAEHFVALARRCDDALVMRIPSESPLGCALAARPELEHVREPRNRVAPPQPLQGRAGQELRRRLRRLAERAPSEIRDITTPEAVHAGFLAFAELHTQMAPARGLDAVLADHQVRQRAAAVMARRAERGDAGIVELHVDGTHAASQVWLRDRETYIAYRSAWDVAWMPYAIGLHVIERLAMLAMQSGASAFEIGPGEEGYKRGWGPTEQTTLRVRLVNRTWRQRLAWWTRRWGPPSGEHATGVE